MVDEFLKIVVYFGVFNSLQFGLWQWLRKRLGALAIVVLTLCVSSVLWRLQLYVEGSLKEQHLLAFLLVSSIFLVGPTVYHLAMSMIAFALEAGYNSKLHFVTPAISLLIEIFLFFTFTEFTQGQITELFLGQANFFRVSVTLAAAHVVFYFILLIKINVQIKESYDIRYTKLVWLILILPTLAITLAAVSFFFNETFILALAGAAITICVNLLFLFTAKYPHFFETLKADIKDQRYATTQLSGINVEKVKQRLLELVHEQKIYRDDQLRLSQLANELLISSHQLSRILNEKFGQNFNGFINSHRIEEAKEQLVQYPEKSILSIAYEVGFNAKSTFNTTFVKLVESTPADFRKKNLSGFTPN